MRTLPPVTLFLLLCMPGVAAAQAGFSIDMLTQRPVLPGASPPEERNAMGRASVAGSESRPARKRGAAKQAATRKRVQPGMREPDYGRGPGFKFYSPSQFESPGPWHRQM